jgi:hypothetical protein
MKKERPSNEGGPCPVSPVYRVGDTVVFKFEGNVRAVVEGCEVVDGRVWLECRALLDFRVPSSHVIAVEPEG